MDGLTRHFRRFTRLDPYDVEEPHDLEVEDRGRIRDHLNRNWRKYVAGAVATAVLGSALWYFSRRPSIEPPVEKPLVVEPLMPAEPTPKLEEKIAPKEPERLLPQVPPTPLPELREYKIKEHTVKHGDTLWAIAKHYYSLTNNRDITNKVNEVNDANLQLMLVDNRAVVKVGYAQEHGLDIISFLPRGKFSYTSDDIAVVKMADGIRGDWLLKIGSKVKLPGLYEAVTYQQPKNVSLDRRIFNANIDRDSSDNRQVSSLSKTSYQNGTLESLSDTSAKKVSEARDYAPLKASQELLVMYSNPKASISHENNASGTDFTSPTKAPISLLRMYRNSPIKQAA